MMSLLLALLLLLMPWLLICILLWLVIPMSWLLAPSGCPFLGQFLYCIPFMKVMGVPVFLYSCIRLKCKQTAVKPASGTVVKSCGMQL
jgi:hypothetical protein